MCCCFAIHCKFRLGRIRSASCAMVRAWDLSEVIQIFHGCLLRFQVKTGRRPQFLAWRSACFHHLGMLDCSTPFTSMAHPAMVRQSAPPWSDWFWLRSRRMPSSCPRRFRNSRSRRLPLFLDNAPMSPPNFHRCEYNCLRCKDGDRHRC